MDAVDVVVGDRVLTAGGARVRVEAVEVSERVLTAYNLTIEDLHTYYAGNDSILVHNAACPTGLRGASPGLKGVFEDGSVRGRSIIGIRSVLSDDGFVQSLADNMSGYLFSKGLREEVRIMRRHGGWDIRIKNEAGNYLDEFGIVSSSGVAHNIEVFSR